MKLDDSVDLASLIEKFGGVASAILSQLFK